MIEGAFHPEASTTSYTYHCNGALATVTEGVGSGVETTTSYGYDALGRLVTVSQAWGGGGGGTVVTHYGYDVQDHLSSVTDGEGNMTRYWTSDRDLLMREESPVTGVTRYRYNEHGKLIEEHRDGRGFSILRTVDAAGRTTLVDYPGIKLDTGYVSGWEVGGVPVTDVGRFFRTLGGRPKLPNALKQMFCSEKK